MVHANILQTIGRTPLVKINNMIYKPGVNIYAKLEGFNPTGSIKDRIAWRMIQQAENAGVLTRDKVIIEPTSGNTGIGLAMIGAARGYQVVIVMSEGVSEERRKILRAFGAEVVLTEKKYGTDGAICRAKMMVATEPDKYFFPNQFSNEYNKIAHYKATSQEIWEQTNGEIDYFVSSIGTSGTIMGVGKALKENKPSIKIVCAYPEKNHYIQGLKNMEEALVPEIYEPDQIDENIVVSSEESFEVARRIVRNEGIFVGMSSGAAMLAAMKLSEKISRGNIVVIFPDRGDKYLSTGLFG
ncbi:MAG: cysteine synthase family protein [Candidatus Marinimicrobia bacterium]|nr:cysteine synthase family protein [Candidatus Neomarinimicrobiota bacterium]